MKIHDFFFYTLKWTLCYSARVCIHATDTAALIVNCIKRATEGAWTWVQRERVHPESRDQYKPTSRRWNAEHSAVTPNFNAVLDRHHCNLYMEKHPERVSEFHKKCVEKQGLLMLWNAAPDGSNSQTYEMNIWWLKISRFVITFDAKSLYTYKFHVD